jgi:hypothetical protein
MQSIIDIEHLAEVYQKLKGSIFLRLISYQFGSILDKDIKEKIQKELNHFHYLNRDLTFEEFVYRYENQF